MRKGVGKVLVNWIEMRMSMTAMKQFAISLIGSFVFGCRPVANRANGVAESPAPSPLSETSIQQNAESPSSITPMNIRCAQGWLPDTESSIESHIRTVAAWATHIRSETARHTYRFRQNPAEFELSEGFFKMLMIAVVLAEDYHIHYKAELKSEAGQTRAKDAFFANPDDVFLTGLLGPKREGTCSSMPVLYVAIGCELGYPLKLVTTKGHMFVRWEGNGERFNIEATAHGLSRFDDEYYRHWPFEITPEEEAAEGYLKSLTPSEELAAFLSIRGMCLREANRIPEAIDAFANAARLAPSCRSYRTMITNLQNQLKAPLPRQNAQTEKRSKSL
jgi:hypothetical protein